MARKSLLVALALLPACITEHGPIPWSRWRTSYPPEYSTPLREKAARMEEYLLSHNLSPEGLLIYSRGCDEFDPEREGSYQNLSDEAMWTGVLLGAFAFKYRVTGTPSDRELLLRVLRGLHLLHGVTGKPGLLARAIFPRSRPVPGESPHQKWRDGVPPHEAYRYRGNVSKDQYFGVLFGFAALTVALGLDAEGRDAEVFELLQPLVTAIADHIWENGLRIVDADGETTEHGGLQGYLLGIPIGPNAALCLGFELIAYRLSGEPRFRNRYERLVRRRYPQATSLVKFELFGKTNHNNDNMGMLGLYALGELEERQAIRYHYDRGLTKLWRYTRHEGNALFHLVYASRFPLPPRARFDLRENLRLFPTDPRVLPLDLRGCPEVEPDCFTNRFGVSKNRTALPLHLRPRSSFVWTRCPFALFHHVEDPGSECVSGVDFLVAYWMARYYLGDPDEPATVLELGATECSGG